MLKVLYWNTQLTDLSMSIDKKYCAHTTKICILEMKVCNVDHKRLQLLSIGCQTISIGDK